MKRLATILCAFALFVLGVSAPAAARSADPYVSLQWGLRVVDAERVHDHATGRGALVAVVDTGVDAAHPDLAGRVRTGWDFVDDDDDASDENGHGTLIAGIIAADGDNGVGGAGVAPGVTILPVRVLDERGVGRSKDVAEGIRFAVDAGADVINLSLAQDTASDPLSNLLADPSVDRAIEDAAAAGATVVIAAGNTPSGGRAETSYDARVAGALVVGASTRNDRRAAYSNHGPSLDLLAPGGGSATDPSPAACTERNGVIAAWWNPRSGASSYGAGCGTSMAVAFVSGTAAMLHAGGSTNVEAVARMIATADAIGGGTGPGRLNVAAAVGVPAPTRVLNQAGSIDAAEIDPVAPATDRRTRVSSKRIRSGAPRPVTQPAAAVVPAPVAEGRGLAVGGIALAFALLVGAVLERQRRWWSRVADLRPFTTR